METNSKIKKIAIVGPESTGKSTISEQLARHYNTVWVPEYAREYCSNLKGPCTWDDEVAMFREQIQLEDQLIKQANKVLICDTMFLTVKIWCDFMFGKSPEEVLEEIPRRPYDLYLLMDIDLPWEDDPLRDFPHLRGYFLEVWMKELDAIGAKYIIVSGNEEERLQKAVELIDKVLDQ